MTTGKRNDGGKVIRSSTAVCNCTGSVTILRRSGTSAEVDVVVAVVILLDETQLQFLPQKLFVSTVEPVLVPLGFPPSPSMICHAGNPLFAE